jgi:hypothetical protein
MSLQHFNLSADHGIGPDAAARADVGRLATPAEDLRLLIDIGAAMWLCEIEGW